MTTNTPSKRLLIPREHGAYGQLMLPLAAALAMGRPTLASGCVVVAALAAFFSHEALLVLVGRRGARAQREQRSRALANGVGWVALALVSGGAGLWLGGEPVLRAALIPLGLAIPLVVSILRGHEKSLIGEIIAAATLTGASIPVAVSTGFSLDRALVVWGAWAIAFTASTCAVRWVITAHKGRRAWAELVVAAACTIAAALLAAQSQIFWAAAPYLIAAWVLIAKPPSTRNIRRVGWTLIAAGVLTASLATVVVRMM